MHRGAHLGGLASARRLNRSISARVATSRAAWRSKAVREIASTRHGAPGEVQVAQQRVQGVGIAGFGAVAQAVAHRSPRLVNRRAWAPCQSPCDLPGSTSRLPSGVKGQPGHRAEGILSFTSYKAGSMVIRRTSRVCWSSRGTDEAGVSQRDRTPQAGYSVLADTAGDAAVSWGKVRWRLRRRKGGLAGDAHG